MGLELHRERERESYAALPSSGQGDVSRRSGNEGQVGDLGRRGQDQFPLVKMGNALASLGIYVAALSKDSPPLQLASGKSLPPPWVLKVGFELKRMG